MITLISHSQHATRKGVLEIKAPRPSPYQSGDLLVAALNSDYLAVGTSPGWTEIIRHQQGPKPPGYDLIGVLFWKIAKSNEPANYKWNLTGPNVDNGFAGATLMVFRGARQPPTTVPVIKQRGKIKSVAPSISGVKGGMLICLWITDDPQLPIAPASMNQLTQFSLWGDGHAVAIEALTSDGPTGTRTAKLNPSIGGGGAQMAFSVVLRPA